jgi:hypothetical protein
LILKSEIYHFHRLDCELDSWKPIHTGGALQSDRVARDTERGSAGLPIGVQVLARPWQDHVVLAVMATIEAEARKQPDYPSRPPLA